MSVCCQSDRSKYIHTSIKNNLNYKMNSRLSAELVDIKFTSENSMREVTNILKDSLPQSDQNVEILLKKSFFLGKHKSSKKKTSPRKKKTYITRNEKDNLGLSKLCRKELKYEEVLPLNKLWMSYIKDYLKLKQNKNNINAKNLETVNMLLLRADFHGAFVTVVRSTCPSQVGLNGICVMDTKNTLVLVSEDNITRTIPKQQSVFHMHIDDIVLTIFGKNMIMRSADRSGRKLKNYQVADI